jgi:hypothetical protein
MLRILVLVGSLAILALVWLSWSGSAGPGKAAAGPDLF